MNHIIKLFIILEDIRKMRPCSFVFIKNYGLRI